MINMAAKIELEIPREVLEHAKDSGISIEEFRKSLEIFGTMQLASETSRLDRKKADAMSERIKARSWEKARKNLGL